MPTYYYVFVVLPLVGFNGYRRAKRAIDETGYAPWGIPLAGWAALCTTGIGRIALWFATAYAKPKPRPVTPPAAPTPIPSAAPAGYAAASSYGAAPDYAATPAYGAAPAHATAPAYATAPAHAAAPSYDTAAPAAGFFAPSQPPGHATPSPATEFAASTATAAAAGEPAVVPVQNSASVPVSGNVYGARDIVPGR